MNIQNGIGCICMAALYTDGKISYDIVISELEIAGFNFSQIQLIIYSMIKGNLAVVVDGKLILTKSGEQLGVECNEIVKEAEQIKLRMN